MERVRTSYDAVAQRYAKEVVEELPDKPVDRAMYQAFAELVGRAHPGDDCAAVGDVGCGPGHVTDHLAGLGLPMHGVDLSPGSGIRRCGSTWAA
jgi:predicted TPR repeat methyltransferase